jgi:uncharacterized protein (DUF488 family)
MGAGPDRAAPGSAAVLAPPVLATAGYEGLVQDQLIDRLKAAGVAVLIDVRAVPNSRKPGFSKRVLAASAEAAGIRYVHIQPLGTPKAGRQAARAGRAGEMEAIFAAHMATDAAVAGLAAARDIARAAPSCLLCFERDPHFCHRRIVAEAIAAETGQIIQHL